MSEAPHDPINRHTYQGKRSIYYTKPPPKLNTNLGIRVFFSSTPLTSIEDNMRGGVNRDLEGLREERYLFDMSEFLYLVL